MSGPLVALGPCHGLFGHSRERYLSLTWVTPTVNDQSGMLSWI